MLRLTSGFSKYGIPLWAVLETLDIDVPSSADMVCVGLNSFVTN